jgi:hypothetical protein
VVYFAQIVNRRTLVIASRSAREEDRMKLPKFADHEILMELRLLAASDPKREVLIEQLEGTPVHICHFWTRWSAIHLARFDPFACWTDAGYAPTRSPIPRDLQLLQATAYGHSDIWNGGFHQFFTNGTGIFAPEMVEFFERIGRASAARTLKMAIEVFDEPFPRSQVARNQFLPPPSSRNRRDWDPFYEMDGVMYNCLPDDGESFDVVADEWIRDVCGIKGLRQPL